MSVPSINQPGHGAPVLAAAGKWNYDKWLMLAINVEHKRFGLPTVLKLDSARVRIVVAIHSHVLISGCDSHDEFKNFFNLIIGNKNMIKLDKETIKYHELSRFYEWWKIEIAKHVAGTNTPLLTKFRRDISSCSPNSYGQIGATRFDTLVVVAFFDFLFPILYLVFLPALGVLVTISETCFLKDLIEKDETTEVNPIALVVMTAKDNHVDKTYMNPNLGTWMREIMHTNSTDKREH